MSVTPLDRTTSRHPGILDQPQVEPRREPQVLPRTTTRPAHAPAGSPLGAPSVRGKVERIRRRGSRLVATLVTQATVFGVIFTGTYVVSSLYGHVRVDEARAMEHSAKARLKASDAQLTEIGKRIDALTNDDAIGAWAAHNHFLAPDQTVVAEKDDAKA